LLCRGAGSLMTMATNVVAAAVTGMAVGLLVCVLIMKQWG
jgi:hypothetical protein